MQEKAKASRRRREEEEEEEVVGGRGDGSKFQQIFEESDQMIRDFLNLLLGAGQESDYFWETVVRR